MHATRRMSDLRWLGLSISLYFSFSLCSVVRSLSAVASGSSELKAAEIPPAGFSSSLESSIGAEVLGTHSKRALGGTLLARMHGSLHSNIFTEPTHSNARINNRIGWTSFTCTHMLHIVRLNFQISRGEEVYKQAARPYTWNKGKHNIIIQSRAFFTRWPCSSDYTLSSKGGLHNARIAIDGCWQQIHRNKIWLSKTNTELHTFQKPCMSRHRSKQMAWNERLLSTHKSTVSKTSRRQLTVLLIL